MAKDGMVEESIWKDVCEFQKKDPIFVSILDSEVLIYYWNSKHANKMLGPMFKDVMNKGL